MLTRREIYTSDWCGESYESSLLVVTKPLLYQLSYASANDEIIADFTWGVKDKIILVGRLFSR